MSVLKYKNNQGKWMGVPSLKGDPGTGVSDVNVTSDGHIKTTLSDGTVIDAGKIPHNVNSVNGKTGNVTLSASDIGAPSDEEFNLTNRVLTYENGISMKFDVMGQTVEIPVNVSTYNDVYVYIQGSAALINGTTMNITPIWSSGETTIENCAFDVWYKLANIVSFDSSLLSSVKLTFSPGYIGALTVSIRYTKVPGDTIDFTVAADAVACNAFVEEEVTSITTTNTLVVVSDTPSVSKAYIYLRYPGTPTTSQVITATPVYSGAEYSAGVVSNMKLNRWYALGVPADGAALSGVSLKVNTGTISTVTAVIRYGGNIDGNGMSY